MARASGGTGLATPRCKWRVAECPLSARHMHRRRVGAGTAVRRLMGASRRPGCFWPSPVVCFSGFGSHRCPSFTGPGGEGERSGLADRDMALPQPAPGPRDGGVALRCVALRCVALRCVATCRARPRAPPSSQGEQRRLSARLSVRPSVCLHRSTASFALQPARSQPAAASSRSRTSRARHDTWPVRPAADRRRRALGQRRADGRVRADGPPASPTAVAGPFASARCCRQADKRSQLPPSRGHRLQRPMTGRQPGSVHRPRWRRCCAAGTSPGLPRPAVSTAPSGTGQPARPEPPGASQEAAHGRGHAPPCFVITRVPSLRPEPSVISPVDPHSHRRPQPAFQASIGQACLPACLLAFPATPKAPCFGRQRGCAVFNLPEYLIQQAQTEAESS